VRDAQGHWPTGRFLRSTDPRRCRPGRNSAHSWRCSGCQRLWSCVSGSDPGAHALPAAARPTPRLGERAVAAAGQRAACSRVCAYSAGAVRGARGRGFERVCALASKGRHPHAPRHAMDLHPLRLRRPRGTRNPPKNGWGMRCPLTPLTFGAGTAKAPRWSCGPSVSDATIRGCTHLGRVRLPCMRASACISPRWHGGASLRVLSRRRGWHQPGGVLGRRVTRTRVSGLATQWWRPGRCGPSAWASDAPSRPQAAGGT
jgi:hypothetical protein